MRANLLHFCRALTRLLPVLAVMAAAGCKSVSVPVAVNTAGDFNLNDVSKIALIDFNSFPGDPGLGVYAADAETCKLVQNFTTSAFLRSKFYSLADLELEKAIIAGSPVRVDRRYDAVMYGRVWWQISPEYRGMYPVKYQLESYKTAFNGFFFQRYTTRLTDVVQTQYFRAWSATLMLSLTVYRIDRNGVVDKAVDTFAVASQRFMIDNGAFFSTYEPLVLHRRDGAATDPAAQTPDFLGGKVVTIPSVEEAKIILADRLVRDLSARLTPSSTVFEVKCQVSDDKLYQLLQNQAYRAARSYIVDRITAELSMPVADKIPPVSAYLSGGKRSPEPVSADIVAKAAAKVTDQCYILAVCEEASGDYEQALYTYRYIYNLDQQIEYARGIGRCQLALGEKDRLTRQYRAKREAEVKAKLK